MIHTSVMPIIQMGNGGPGKDKALPKVLMPELGLEPRALALQAQLPLQSTLRGGVRDGIWGRGCN